MAMVVTVFNQKGGSGKTSLSMQLAGTMGMRGYRVLVIDMDPQGTASRWYSAGGDGSKFHASVISLALMEGQMHREVQKQLENYDVIFIDCPPAVGSAAPTSAMLVSDLVLIPVVPSPADIWAAEAAKKLAGAARVQNPSLDIRVVPNMVQRTSSLARDLLEVMAEDLEIPVTRSQLGSRAAFRECQILGLTVHAVPRAQTAVDEVESMTDEILGLLRLKLKKGAKK